MARSIKKDVDKGFKGGVVKSDESYGCFKIRLRETQGRMQIFGRYRQGIGRKMCCRVILKCGGLCM